LDYLPLFVTVFRMKLQIEQFLDLDLT
jgi:hypothetical protein